MISSSMMKVSNSSSLLISMIVLFILTMRLLLLAFFVFALILTFVNIFWISRFMTMLFFLIIWMLIFMIAAVSVTKNFLTSLLFHSSRFSRSSRSSRRRLIFTCSKLNEFRLINFVFAFSARIMTSFLFFVF